MDIEPPSFDLGITKTPRENAIGVYSPENHVVSNLAKEFNNAAQADAKLTSSAYLQLDNDLPAPPVPPEV